MKAFKNTLFITATITLLGLPAFLHSFKAFFSERIAIMPVSSSVSLLDADEPGTPFKESPLN